ncbi:MAG TPA: FAD-binding oxidoreductase [Allosphingosinicella sp.]|nr:FAD-binding oxidoreductase [Allosphingosinicella sp.]
MPGPPSANPPSERLMDALAARLGPRGLTRAEEEMAPWLTDWRGRHRGKAAALVSPASLEEVQAVVAACAEEKVALVPQGGNTSMVAGATPDGSGAALLLSLRRMNRIRAVSAEDNVLVAEAGAILANVHEAALAIGRRFPLSLGARGSATIGGLVSTNAGGTQVLRFGTMRQLVLGLEAVFPDGSVLNDLSALRKDNRGYDPKQWLIGAEGTLGIVTAASLRLVAAIGSRGIAWIGLSSPSAALKLLRFLEDRLGEAVESFELVPAIALDLLLRHVPGTRAPLDRPWPWNVLVETVAPAGGGDAAERLEQALGEALDAGLAGDAILAASESQAEAFWRLRESIAEAERAEGPGLKHDISVPVATMPAFLESEAPAIEAAFPGVRVIAFGHLGDGNIHFNLIAPREAGPSWLRDVGAGITRSIYDRVTAAGGSISAEHGIGQSKRDALARTAEPARIALQRRIKAALDPSGIMNPGKLLP